MKDLNQDQKFNMKKNLTLYIFLILAIIALYISTKTYKNFSLDKSIGACVISQLKKNNVRDLQILTFKFNPSKVWATLSG